MFYLFARCVVNLQEKLHLVRTKVHLIQFWRLVAGLSYVKLCLSMKICMVTVWKWLLRVSFLLMLKEAYSEYVSCYSTVCSATVLLLHPFPFKTVQCAYNRPAYFAQRLHKAINGLGTKEYAINKSSN